MLCPVLMGDYPEPGYTFLSPQLLPCVVRQLHKPADEELEMHMLFGAEI